MDPFCFFVLFGWVALIILYCYPTNQHLSCFVQPNFAPLPSSLVSGIAPIIIAEKSPKPQLTFVF